MLEGTYHYINTRDNGDAHTQKKLIGGENIKKTRVVWFKNCPRHLSLSQMFSSFSADLPDIFVCPSVALQGFSPSELLIQNHGLGSMRFFVLGFAGVFCDVKKADLVFWRVKQAQNRRQTDSRYIPYHTISYHTISYHTMPYHIIPCHAMPYHAMPSHTIPYIFVI